MNNLFSLMNKTETIIDGHFKLTSGKHSDIYLEKFRLLENPVILDQIGKLFYNELKQLSPDIVLGAAIGGILLSNTVAKEFGTIGIFAERINGQLNLKRGFEIGRKNKVLIIEDIVTTGGSIFELIELIEKNNATCIGVGSLVDRSQNGIKNFSYPFFSLYRHPSNTWEQKDCPLCKRNIPINSRGRTGK